MSSYSRRPWKGPILVHKHIYSMVNAYLAKTCLFDTLSGLVGFDPSRMGAGNVFALSITDNASPYCARRDQNKFICEGLVFKCLWIGKPLA
jgi:hypothetical protein